MIEIIPITGFPLVNPDDNIVTLILETLEDMEFSLESGDIIVITHSIVSIVEGSMFHESEVEISARAYRIAKTTGQSPVKIELALQSAEQVLRESPVLITRTKSGIITDYSGVDRSNSPPRHYLTLPEEPDISAKKISEELTDMLGFHIPVIISDTQGRPWRRGAVNLAIGVYGLSPLVDNSGKIDLYGRILHSSVVCQADELAAAAELVMGQAAEGVPIAVLRGITFQESTIPIHQVFRSDEENLFK